MESRLYVAALLALPGSMLTPNLRLLRLLGRGGMGSVWLAEHLVLGNEVAVKLLSSELADNPEALERFRREANAVAQLKSPHVVAIHDFGEADGVPFFVMEQLVGEDLHQRLDRVGRLPIGIATAIVVQTCRALARVHELGVVHRDLKPGNIFLTDADGDLVVKLLDFGVAKTRSLGAESKHVTSDQAVLGTPLYMSPEQFLSPRNVGPASDLYSLAVVIYECLAGQPPFDGETAGALHVAIANGRYTPITGVDKSLPLALDGWFAKAFASEANDRFHSAREMADAFLAAARGGRSTSAAPLTAAIFTPKPSLVPATASFASSSAPTPSLASAAPFIAGVLAVLALVGGIWIFGARHSSAASSTTTASSPTALPPAIETAGAASAAPAESASATPAPAEIGSADNAIVDDAPPSAASAAPPSSAVIRPTPAAVTTPSPAPMPIPMPSPNQAKPHRKNRGF